MAGKWSPEQEETLYRLWFDPKVTDTQMSRELDIPLVKIRAKAGRLGYPRRQYHLDRSFMYPRHIRERML